MTNNPRASATSPPQSDKRPPSLLQQRLAVVDAAEADATSWISRAKTFLRLAFYFLVGGHVVIALRLWPDLFPNSLTGWLMQLGALSVFFVYGCLAYLAEMWVNDRVENYWFWRAASITGFLAIAAAMLYFAIVTADAWSPHFR